MVSILNFIVFEEKEAQNILLERIRRHREKAKMPYSEKLNLIFVELPKFNKKAEELKTNTDSWLFLLKNTCELKACPPEITRKIFKSFLEEAKVEHLTQTEMETYAKSLRQSHEVMDIANFARMKGKKEGRIEGKMEGEMAKNKLFVTKCAQDGMSIEKIAFYTNLTEEQVSELIKQNL